MGGRDAGHGDDDGDQDDDSRYRNNRSVGNDRISDNSPEEVDGHTRLTGAPIEHGTARLHNGLKSQAVIVAEKHLALNFYRDAYCQADSPGSSRPLTALGGPNANPPSARFFQLRADEVKPWRSRHGFPVALPRVVYLGLLCGPVS